MADEKRMTAPYGSFDTSQNTWLRFAEAVPPRIDRSAFPGLSWNAVTRLLGGFRFLGLIDDEDRPQPPLFKLAVRNEEEQKAALGFILRVAYAEVFKEDLARMTPSHLADIIGNAYGAAGDTREKAVRFFLNAATYAGIPLSPLLTREKGRRSPSGPRAKRKPTVPAKFYGGGVPEPPQNPGATRTIQLFSGGSVTLTTSVDFLTLNPDDRKFVFELIDKLGQYEQ